jgi:chromosomal replication initiator protein
MGKTHLLHALASKAHQQGWAVACFRAEEFTSRYMTAYREQQLPSFQAAVRGARLFVLDDLQYLHGKPGIQEELVHIVDTLSLGGGYVAFGSERSPLDLGFTERLASRLVAGTSVHVQPFRYPERLAYATCVACERHCELPAWALERVAHIEAPSIRVLLGAVNAAISLERSGMLELARLDTELLKRSLEAIAPRATSDRTIAEAIARHFQTTFEELAGRSRKPAVTAARGATVAALKEHGRSNAEIAKLLGDRDRTTISQLGGRGRELLDADPALRRLATG